MKTHYKSENHKINNSSFLRAAVMGANDGLISTSSLIVGMSASGLDRASTITASVAALFAGAISMAAGEYVSVSSQADLENAEIRKEKLELDQHPNEELRELVDIYIDRGLSKNLAEQVALELTEKNALDAHLRDELGITNLNRAKPLNAAVASAVTFGVGSFLPITGLWLIQNQLVIFEVILTVVLLFITGGIAAKTSNAPVLKGSIRVSAWGIAAILVTYFIGQIIS